MRASLSPFVSPPRPSISLGKVNFEAGNQLVIVGGEGDGLATRTLDLLQARRRCAAAPAAFPTARARFSAALPTPSLPPSLLLSLQFHFHAPAEHAVAGRHADLEAHLVHREAATGRLAVLGVLFQAGDGARPNPCLAAALASAPASPSAPAAPLPRPLSPKGLLPPPGARYVHYRGSLTTPPCTEGVDWFVFTRPAAVPGAQVLAFLRYAGAGATLSLNARPLQPIGRRELEAGAL